MTYEWYQADPIPFPYQRGDVQEAMMREPNHGHGGGYHGGPHHGNPGHQAGYGKPPHGPQGDFQVGVPFLGGLVGGLLAGSLYPPYGGYSPYGPYPNTGYYPAYPSAPYPPYQGYPNYPYPPYNGYY